MNDHPREPERKLISYLLRDPLSHFVAGGVLLFVLWAGLAPQAAPSADPMRIEITEADMRQIALVWLSQGRDLPSPDQMRKLAHQEATQRVLVREALALGLDQDDEIIARRLAQKMDFLLADLATLAEPSRSELHTWFERNLDRFAMPPRVSFRHLYFSQDKRGLDGARADAQDLLPTLAGVSPDDPRLPALADRFMFLDYYGGKTPLEVSKAFGPAFADALFALSPGGWLGPLRSGYGWHLVYIDTLAPPHTADFETIRPAIRSAWLDERYREIRDRAYAEMLSRYTIVLPDPEAIDLALSRRSAQLTSGEAAQTR